MPTATGLAEEVAQGVRDRHTAWRFIQGFAEQWASPLALDDGWDDAELAAAEYRLGVRFPAALREAYGLFGRRADLTSTQDSLLSPDQLHVDASGEVLVFREENQGAAHWGVRLADMGAVDPPVVMRLDLADKAAESWEAWLGRFSLACIEMVLSETVLSEEELGDNRAATEADVVVLEQRYTQLPIPEYPVSQTSPGVRWFAGPDVLVRDDGRQWLWVRARTSASFESVLCSLPGEWELDQ